VWPGSPKNNNEWKPLLYATAKRHKAVVKLLLARKDVEVDSVDDGADTVIDYGNERGRGGG
jgi:hypothetical protein